MVRLQQPVDTGQHQPAAAQSHFAEALADEDHRVIGKCAPAEVDDEMTQTDAVERSLRHRHACCTYPIAHMTEVRTSQKRLAQPVRLRHRQARQLEDEPCDHRIRGVVTQEVRHDPIGRADRAVEKSVITVQVQQAMAEQQCSRSESGTTLG